MTGGGVPHTGLQVNRGQEGKPLSSLSPALKHTSAMDESVSSSQTHTLRQLAGIHRLTQLLYASPPAHLPVATEFAPPSLTMVPRVRTYQVGERMLAITADSRRTSQEAMV